MRRMSAAVMTAVGLVALAAATPSTPARAEPDAELRDLVTRHVQPLLLPPGGMAVALTIDGRTEFFNFGMADTARKQAMTSDALFNLASVGKVFTSTLLAQAVKIELIPARAKHFARPCSREDGKFKRQCGMTRMSENRIAASKPKRRTGCSVTSSSGCLPFLQIRYKGWQAVVAHCRVMAACEPLALW